MAKLDSKIPQGSLSEKWTNHKSNINLVSPANKRLIDVIVVGTGLAGASASATLAELGYNVKDILFSRFSSQGAFDRCSRRDQCCKKLSRGWRFYLPTFLRYHQGGGLPFQRIQRLSFGGGIHQYH